MDGDDFLACSDIIDDVHKVCLGSDRAERTGVDAVTALDALTLIDHADAVVIISDRADRAGLLAGTDQMSDRAVRAGLRAHAALFTLIGINMSSALADRDRAELTGIDTCLAHTQTAVIRYGIGGQRTFLTCRADDLHDILRLGNSVRALRKRKSDSLFNKFSLFVYTAAVCSHGTRDDLIDQFFLMLFVKFPFPCQLGSFLHDLVLKTHQCSIIGYHSILLSAFSVLYVYTVS